MKCKKRMGVKVRLRICSTCPHRVSESVWKCRLAPSMTMCYKKRPGSICPASPPKW